MLNSKNNTKNLHNILKEYFNEETKECWNLRTNIIVEWYGKMQKLKDNGTANK